MSGMQMALMVSGGAALPASLAAGGSQGQTAVGGGGATGRVQLGADGSVSYLGQLSEVGPGGPARWATRIQAGFGAGIYVKATVTAGSLPSNPATAYTLLSSGLNFTFGATTGAGSATVTFDFSYDGVTSALTSAGWTVAYIHA